jgi:hypothetical protein
VARVCDLATGSALPLQPLNFTNFTPYFDKLLSPTLLLLIYTRAIIAIWIVHWTRLSQNVIEADLLDVTLENAAAVLSAEMIAMNTLVMV